MIIFLIDWWNRACYHIVDRRSYFDKSICDQKNWLIYIKAFCVNSLFNNNFVKTVCCVDGILNSLESMWLQIVYNMNLKLFSLNQRIRLVVPVLKFEILELSTLIWRKRLQIGFACLKIILDFSLENITRHQLFYSPLSWHDLLQSSFKSEIIKL